MEAPAPTEPWQAMALEKLVGLLTTRAGMDLVSLAVAIGAQHSTAAVLQHMNSQRGLGPPLTCSPIAAAASPAAVSSDGRERPSNSSPSQHFTRSPVLAAEAPHSNPIVGQLLSWATSREVRHTELLNLCYRCLRLLSARSPPGSVYAGCCATAAVPIFAPCCAYL